MIYVNVTTPAGSTVERTEKVLDQLELVTKEIKSVENVSTLAGYSLMSDISGASYGMAMINLAPWDEREQTVDELIEELREQRSTLLMPPLNFLLRQPFLVLVTPVVLN